MTERSGEIDEVKKSLDRERANLLTALAAVSFLCICLFVVNISLGAYSVTVTNERDAVSVALDDQRLQYYRCVRDEEFTADCDDEMVSPASRDIKRDLDGAGFSDLLYDDESATDPLPDVPDGKGNREAFGLLGYIVYGDSE